MALHFSREELAARRTRACALMAEDGFDGLLMFRQESMYYLTGYDTFGYVFFQCLVLTADGRMALLTRAPDLRQAWETSVVEDVRVWVDAPDADPAGELREILRELGLAGSRLGVEYEAYGLTAQSGKRVEAAARLGIDRTTLYRIMEKHDMGRSKLVDGSRSARQTDSSSFCIAWARPMLVVVLPSPAGVGLTAVTSTYRPAPSRSRCASL